MVRLEECSNLGPYSVFQEILLRVLITDIEGGEDHYFIEEIKKEIFQWIREHDKLTW